MVSVLTLAANHATAKAAVQGVRGVCVLSLSVCELFEHCLYWVLPQVLMEPKPRPHRSAVGLGVTPVKVSICLIV